MAQTAASSRQGSRLWVQGLACGALLTFAAPTVLVLVVMLAPAVICLLADASPDRGLLRAVTIACAAASIGPVWHLWMAGDRLEQALATLSDPLIPLLAWGAGASAWALCQIVPVLLRSSWDLRSTAKIRSLENELKAFEEDWELETADPA